MKAPLCSCLPQENVYIFPTIAPLFFHCARLSFSRKLSYFSQVCFKSRAKSRHRHLSTTQLFFLRLTVPPFWMTSPRHLWVLWRTAHSISFFSNKDPHPINKPVNQLKYFPIITFIFSHTFTHTKKLYKNQQQNKSARLRVNFKKNKKQTSTVRRNLIYLPSVLEVGYISNQWNSLFFKFWRHFFFLNLLKMQIFNYTYYKKERKNVAMKMVQNMTM